MVHELEHDFLKFFLGELAVPDADAQRGNQLLSDGRHFPDGFDSVVDEVDLSSATEFALDSGLDQGFGEGGDDGLDRQAILGRSLNDGDIAQTDQRHVQRPGDGRRAHAEHVDILLNLFQALLVADAESLFLVHNQQTEVCELNVFRQDAVRADQDIDSPRRDALKNFFLLAQGAETVEHLDGDGEGGKALLEGFEMLKRQNRSRRQHRYLFIVSEGLECGSHSDFGFAKADIAADESIHRSGRFHILLDFSNRLALVFGGRVLERIFKLALEFAVGREGETFRHSSLGVEFEQLVGHIDQPSLDLGLGAVPGLPAHAIETRLTASGTVMFLDKIEPRKRDVQLGAFGVFDNHEVFLPGPLRDRRHSPVAADAVLGVNNQVAHREVFEIREKRGSDRLALLRSSDQFGSSEDVFAAIENNPCIGEGHAVGQSGPDDERSVP